MCLYQDSDQHKRFVEEWKKTGKKLDMGKACIRFKELEDVSLDLIGKVIAQVTAKNFIAHYEAVLAEYQKVKQTRAAKKSTSVKKAKATATKKKAGAKKEVAKKSVKKK